MAHLRLVAVLLVAASCGRSLPVDGSALPQRAGKFIAVGVEGAILSSLDGTTWTVESSGTTRSLSSAAAGRSTIVAAGAAGTVLTSTNGADWIVRSSGTSTDLSHVIFTGEKFIAVGGSWSTGAAVIESVDGAAWTLVTSPSNYMFRAVAHRGGQVVASANYKSDLQTPALFATRLSEGSAAGSWEQRKGPDFSDSLTLGDRIMVLGRGIVASSTDGITWSEQKAEPDRAIAHSGETFVIVGEAGAISTSTEGTRWTAAQKVGAAWLSGVAYGTPGFVAVGSSGFIGTSSTGATWSKQTAVTKLHLNDVAWFP